ncbi:hypothetical protein HYFRA_00009742 [Hymenoscyphus fraxineus]|uniref:O-methyltransferase C-terminal domain-containing protein n=1 Tax=Hymenoscyphus fraxineus TaxID=746836 RepID=A0A9N9KV07_9HELO|nr:hypothetical protein HYFRA_00009742 [Hymenoscyphus fraxineus]
MMPGKTITELASIISDNTAIVNDYITAQGLEQPSFDVDAPNSSVIPLDATEIQAARGAVIDATLMLRDLVLGPKEHLLGFSHNCLLSMQAISRFKIAATFPIHEEATFAQISEKCGVNEHDVKRILRHAMTNHIFKEPRKGVVAHTAASRLLFEDAQTADWVGSSTDDLWQAASQTVNAMVKFPGSQEPNETGFALANNTTKSAFEYLSGHPQRARRFGSAMKAYTEETGFNIQFVADNYPWKELGNATVVDVGGSHGFTCTHLATLFPSLKFVVQDLPPVVEAGAKTISKNFYERIQFMAHDFFEEQPVHGADIYFFRWIFHNWSDKYCIKILQALIPALKKGAKILINDNVLPEPGVLPMWREEKVRAMDLTMLELQNARERELEDWAKLFEDADPRFKFLGGKQPKGASLWILEAVWEG